MTIRELITAIAKKHKSLGIKVLPPATSYQIRQFEQKIGFELPADFREFYSVCNGFECAEDIFTISSLETILGYTSNYGTNWYHFAEHMIYSGTWSLRKVADSKYEIFYEDLDSEIILGTSIQEFLTRFLVGNVFEEGGLYDWYEEKRPVK